MIIWVTVIIGLAFAALGFQKGVYTMYATLFNVLVAVFVSLFCTPLILQNSPFLETGYYGALSLLLLTLTTFAILQGITYYLFLRGADYLFPTIFDKAAGALCGFFVGWITSGLLILVFCIMPVSIDPGVQGVLPADKTSGFGKMIIAKACGFTGAFSFEYNMKHEAEQTSDFLITLNDPQAHQKLLEERKNLKDISGSSAEEYSETPAQPARTEPPAPAQSPTLPDESDQDRRQKEQEQNQEETDDLSTIPF